MGKWNRRYMNRPRRRYYQDYQWSPPRDEPCPDPETEVWQDNVPLWEKKFCYLVGRMPWRKILSTKNFMHGPSNVLTWDDSAGEEAFLNAKKRFWEEFNGLPCETQLPNPNLYVDEIDWNPYIDPILVRELDQAYFNPDDKYNLPSSCSSKGNNGWPDDVDNPWEQGYEQNHAVKNKDKGWSDTSKLTKNDDPWESHNKRDNTVVKDTTWGGGCDKSWESHNKWDNTVVKDTTWRGVCDKSWVSKPQNNSGVSNNWSCDGNSWKCEDNGWQNHGACSRTWNQKTTDLYNSNYQSSNYKQRLPGGRGNMWVQKRSDNDNWKANDYGNISRGHGPFNGGCRKREIPDQYAANHKGPRLQRGDSQSSHYWSGGNNKRVTFGGQWS